MLRSLSLQRRALTLALQEHAKADEHYSAAYKLLLDTVGSCSRCKMRLPPMAMLRVQAINHPYMASKLGIWP